MTDPAGSSVTIVPTNEASWGDLQAVFGTRGEPSRCQCQPRPARRAASLPTSTASRSAGAPTSRARTTLACSSRPASPWEGRTEDKTDDSVWAVTCFVTRSGFRRRGSSRAFARKAVDFARDRDARALEGYPMIDEPAQGWLLGEFHVGSRSVFADTGFTEVGRPTVRRVVMRIDF